MIYFLMLLLFAFSNSTTISSMVCTDIDRVDESIMHLCCKHPDSHDIIVKACAEKSNSEAITEPFLDATSEELISNTCFAKCIFEQYDFLNDRNLDMDAVRKHYANSTDNIYANEMIAAFEHCHSQVEEKLSKLIADAIFHLPGEKQCNPKSSVIWACVIREFFNNCPKELWSGTEQCHRLLNFNKNCKSMLS